MSNETNRAALSATEMRDRAKASIDAARDSMNAAMQRQGRVLIKETRHDQSNATTDPK